MQISTVREEYPVLYGIKQPILI